MCRSEGVAKTTRAVEWYHPICGIPNVAAMIHRHATFRIQLVRLNGTTPRPVIPTEMKWSGGIYSSGKLYLTQVIVATWVDSSTPFSLMA